MQRVVLLAVTLGAVGAISFFLVGVNNASKEEAKLVPQDVLKSPIDLTEKIGGLEAKLRSRESEIRDRDESIEKLSERLGDLEKRLLASEAQVKDLQDVAMKFSQTVATMRPTDKSRAEVENLTKSGFSSERSQAVVAFHAKIARRGQEQVLASLGKAAPSHAPDSLDAEIAQAGGLAAYVRQGLQAALQEDFPKFESLAVPRDPTTGEYYVGLQFMGWGQDNPGLVYWRQFLRPE